MASFINIVARLGSQADSFEEFCCQIALHSKPTEGSRFARIDGSGGDGGVECFWIQQDGSKVGWQAKFVFDTDRLIAQLSGSINTALAVHPTLTKYIVCIPFNPTGETARPGRSQLEKLEDWRTATVAKVGTTGRTVEIEILSESTLLDRLLAIDPHQGRLRFWFDQDLLSRQWFEERLDDTFEAAKPRYTSALNVETPVSQAFDVLCNSKRWHAEVEKQFTSLKKAHNEWQSGLEATDEGWGRPFPASLRAEGDQIAVSLGQLVAIFKSLIEAEAGMSAQELDGLTDKVIDDITGLIPRLRKEVEDVHGTGSADNAAFKQRHSEHFVSFPAMHYDNALELRKTCLKIQEWLGLDRIELIGEPGMLLVGDAGAGKTHAICDVAKARLDDGGLSIVCLAEALPGQGDPLRNLMNHLGVSADIGWEQFLQLLDTAAEVSRHPLLIAIDGVNETDPRTYWQAQIKTLIARIRRYPNLRLCISCRSTYVDLVIPADTPIKKVEHRGFQGMENEACRQFCAHYNLLPPTVPFLAKEFQNALFLKLVCEAASDAGETALPVGSVGISQTMDVFLDNKGARYARAFGIDPRFNIPRDALNAIVAKLRERRSRSLPIQEAEQVMAVACPRAHDRFFEWMVSEGLLRIDAVRREGGISEEIFLPFERLGDHILASSCLVQLSVHTIGTAFMEDGLLSFTLERDSWEELAGLREALALQIPEKFGLEIVDLLPETFIKSVGLQLMLLSFPMRSPVSLTERTRELVIEALGEPTLSDLAFDQLLLIGTQPSLLDATWLDTLLRRHRMARRDAVWCHFLHDSYQERRAVRAMLDLCFSIDPAVLPNEVAERWIIAFGWFFAAADRRVRDHATKATTRILESHPALWSVVMERFLSVDDEYVLERVLLSIYGAMMRNREVAAIQTAAQLLLDTVFDRPQDYVNALIRDHCRCIVELALHVGALKEVDRVRIQPPFQSDWPLVLMDPETVARMKESHQAHRLLAYSCFDDDFYVYTLNSLRDYFESVPKDDMATWIYGRVFSMGYSGELHGFYERDMTSVYGGGRAKPTWAERIGKKYQWIALSQLAAILSDNAEKVEEDDWYDKPIGVPLIFERGRDTDPSIQVPGSGKSKEPCWWSPFRYDFERYQALSNDEWVALEEDTPDLAGFLQCADDRGEWLVLHQYITQQSSRFSDDEYDRDYRVYWFHVHSYVCESSVKADLLAWATGTNWFNRWMPEGNSSHEGFIGEYPWAQPFCVERPPLGLVRRPHDNLESPVPLIPTTGTVSAEHEYDSFQLETVRVNVPSPEMFLPGMEWVPDASFKCPDRETPAFFDPSVTEAGIDALLANKEQLSKWLLEQDKVILFTVLGEKFAAIDNAKPRHIVSAGVIFDGLAWKWTPVSHIMH